MGFYKIVLKVGYCLLTGSSKQEVQIKSKDYWERVRFAAFTQGWAGITVVLYPLYLLASKQGGGVLKQVHGFFLPSSGET